MGTRNLTCVFIDGEYKVAQYCQWDGYPGGRGKAILKFLRGEAEEDNRYFQEYDILDTIYNEEKFKENVKACKYMTDLEIKNKWKELGAESNMVTFEQSDKMKKLYPQLQRDMGNYVLPYIQKNGGIGLVDSISFAGDSLFCEWCYVIDYDTNMFEVYTGFVQEKHDGRFSKFEAKKDPMLQKFDFYYPIKIYKSWSLSNLPTESEFLTSMEIE